MIFRKWKHDFKHAETILSLFGPYSNDKKRMIFLSTGRRFGKK